jgi:hypothetical protein
MVSPIPWLANTSRTLARERSGRQRIRIAAGGHHVGRDAHLRRGRPGGAVPSRLPGPLRGFHAVALHEVELLLGARRRCSVPQFMKVGEVAVEWRAVKHEESRRRVGSVAEGVPDAAWHEYPSTCRPDVRLAFENERDVAIEDEVRLVAVDVPMRRRHSSASWERALHQGEASTRAGCEGFEDHFASASLVPHALVRPKDGWLRTIPIHIRNLAASATADRPVGRSVGEINPSQSAAADRRDPHRTSGPGSWSVLCVSWGRRTPNNLPAQRAGKLLEVAGIEPASSGFSMGLLRAQPAD